MDIGEMHVWFRQYAQQMGMQNVRAILPEQIDILINTSITDTVNQIIRENVGITNDRIITDNSKIGQINALKHLYKVKEIPFYSPTLYRFYTTNPNVLSVVQTNQLYYDDSISGSPTINKIKFSFIINYGTQQVNAIDIIIPFSKINDFEYIKEVFKTEHLIIYNGIFSITPNENPRSEAVLDCYIDFEIDANELVNPQLLRFSHIELLDSNDDVIGGTNYTPAEVLDTQDFVLINTTNFEFNKANFYNGLVTYKESLENYLFLVDFSINYQTSVTGITEAMTDIEYTDSFRTNLFPIRLIDDAYLADTLNDFILKPRLRSPIAVIVNSKFQIYLGSLSKHDNGYFLENNLIPNIIRMSYIAKPAIVKYSEDINGININCDLPDYMHVDILKHAVDLYRAAISGGISASQAQEQTQQQENVRNNYRNEGYQ